MAVTMDIRTFVSIRKPGSAPRRDPGEILQEVRELLTDRVRREISLHRIKASVGSEELGPVILCIRPAEMKENGLDLPDIWISITVPRRVIGETERMNLYGELNRIVQRTFVETGFTILLELDLTEKLSYLFTTASEPN